MRRMLREQEESKTEFSKYQQPSAGEESRWSTVKGATVSPYSKPQKYFEDLDQYQTF